jgi:membrane-bound serine protease (ClpP class)
MDPQYLTFGIGLICAGLLVLVAEAFVISMGLLTAIATGLIIIGVIFCFKYGFWAGMATMLVLSLVLPILLVWALALFRKNMVKARPAEEGVDLPEVTRLAALLGKIGTAMTDLSPAGLVNFEGQRVDVISQGLLLKRGSWVKCILVEGSRVVVIPADPVDAAKPMEIEPNFEF